MLLTSQSTHPASLSPLPTRCVKLAGVPRAAAGRPARPVAIQSSSTSSEAELAATPASKCPFAGNTTSSSTTVPQPAAVAAAQQQQVAALSGPGWRVLPPGDSSASSSLPQPQGHRSWLPLLGDVLEFERLGAGAFMLQRYRQFGPVFTWQLGGDRLVSVVEYETVKSLLQNGDSKVMSGWNPEALYAMLGEGARGNLENPANRLLSRKVMAPGFAKEALRGYLTKLEDICESQLAAWAASGQPVDLVSEGKALSFEFSTQLLVDFEVPEQQKPDMKRKLDALFQGMFAPPINLPGTTFAKGLKAKAELQQDIIAIIKSRDYNNNTNANNDASNSSSSSSVFQSILAARRQTQTTDGNLTDQQMADAGIGIIIAGNDTSGLGVTALLALLPLFPAVMERLRQEQQQLIAKHGPALTPAVLDGMTYADAVVKEALRVVPPSNQVFRKTLVDLEICGRFVPAGSILYLSTFLGQVLTDPRLNSPASLTPDQLAALQDRWLLLAADGLLQDFKPERWLAAAAAPGNSGSSNGSGSSVGEAAAAAKKPSGLLTFSVGPHICLGLSLYMTEAKVLLAKLARGYDLAPASDPAALAFKPGFVTQLASRSLLRVTRRQQGAAQPAAAAPVAAR